MISGNDEANWFFFALVIASHALFYMWWLVKARREWLKIVAAGKLVRRRPYLFTVLACQSLEAFSKKRLKQQVLPQ